MGFFEKLFGNKNEQVKKGNLTTLQPDDEIIIANDDSTVYKLVRRLSDNQKQKIEASPILLRTGQLYMHYWTANLVCLDRNDQEWRNKVMYFWKAEEPFPNKSLPPFFEDFDKKYFLFQGDTSIISLKVGEATPWFGMPGMGQKHVCEVQGQDVTIPELYDMGLIEYVEQIELTDENLNILMDKENYYFLVDENLTPFYNGNFHLDGKPISISLAYSIGGIHIIKKSDL